MFSDDNAQNADDQPQTDASESAAPVDAPVDEPVDAPVADADDLTVPEPEPNPQPMTAEEVLAGVEQELVDTRRGIETLTIRAARLAKERDRLTALLLPQSKVTQADALKAIVESGQRLRQERAERAAAFSGGVGFAFPSVRTPAEQAALRKR